MTSDPMTVVRDSILVPVTAGITAAVTDRLLDGVPIVLVGPAGVGKTSIIASLDVPNLLAIDPFARLTSQSAAAIRRALDAGRPCVAAARTLDRRTLGRAGRIAWRFIPVYVPLVPPPTIRHHVGTAFERLGFPEALARRAIPDIARAAAGRPAVAAAVTCRTFERWKRGGAVPGAAALAVDIAEERTQC